MAFDTYKTITAAAAAPINASSGAQGTAGAILPAGTLLQVSTDQDVLKAMASDDTVAAHAPDGTIYAVKANDLALADSAGGDSPIKLYAIVGIGVALVLFMSWNTNRK